MRIAIIGTRGIPARYGGFETFAQELSTRLVARGHDVTVFGRTPFFSAIDDSPYEGVKRCNAWTLFSKYLETPLAALTSFLILCSRRDVDVVLLCNAANSIFAFLPKLFGIPVVINVDGIERKRAKWGLLGKVWYRLGEFFSALFANCVIADANSITQYYSKTFGVSTALISYGAEKIEPSSESVLEEYSLTRNKYYLYVSRLEPENNALGVIKAYKLSKKSMPLVIVGDAPYASDYKAALEKEAKGSSVIFTGYQFGDAYRELRNNCYLYIQATEVGGTHPALIEGMAAGNCVVANGVPEHFEVLGGAGVYYSRNDYSHLSRVLNTLAKKPETVEKYGAEAKQRASVRYSWDKVTNDYEELFDSVKK